MAFDIRVFESQQWVNALCYNVPGYNAAPEDGQTGWSTMFSLTRALQHVLGITALSDTFGNGTLTALTSQFPVINQNTSSMSTPGNATTTAAKVVGIVQAALWCKGYWSGTTFGLWNVDTGNSLESITGRIGLTPTRSVTPKVFKSLLTMDAYVVVGSGTTANREVQQWLNSRYLNRKDFYVIPTDGYYSRDVQRGLMFAIQYELSMPDGTANGNFGPGTQSGLQTYGVFGTGASDSTRKLVQLYQGALRFNGYSSTPFNGTFDSATSTNTTTFQSFTELSTTGSANFGTWASLLVSTGDPNRSTLGSDTSVPLDSSKATALYVAGYRTVGRYLNGTEKRIMPGELSRIFAAGLTMFPIYQEYNDTVLAFDYGKGYEQGLRAVKRARQTGFKSGALIYFAVDYDATGDEITAAVIPFFQGVRDAVNTSKRVTYQVGVYGTRNVCARISAAGLAMSSFVAGMSTGYSGNLGFPLPTNWAYDQIKEFTFGSGIGAFPLDKDVRRSNAPQVTASGYERTPMLAPPPATPAYDEAGYWRWSILQYGADLVRDPTYVNVGVMNDLMLLRLQRPTYWAEPGTTPTPLQLFWRYAYTPVIWENPTAPPWANQIQAAYESFATLLEGADYPLPEHGPLGDRAHFAASTRGYLGWTVPTLGSNATYGDYGAWALDLVTLWRDYEMSRLEAPGGVLDVASYMAANLGVNDDLSFGQADLKADAAAFLVAKQIAADDTRPLADIIRVLYINCEDDAGYLASQFQSQRFGNRAAVVAIAKSIFTQPWPNDFLIASVFPTRFPGTYDEREDYDNPPIEVRETELQAVAEAFADAIENAQI